MGNFLVSQGTSDDTRDLTTLTENGIGDPAHESDVTASIDESDPLASE